MIKITLSDEILNIHELYFKKYICFENDISIKTKELSKLNQITKSNFNKYKITSNHKKFMGFCRDNIEKFSTGTPDELSKLISQIEKDFPIIVEMIENKINVIYNNNVSKKKEMRYSDVLYTIFRYDKFSTINSNNLKLKTHSMSKNKKDKLLNTILKDNNGLVKSSAERLLNLIHNTWNIEEDIIENRIISKHFLGFWGAYAYSYMINLRVCPYCNRQYITPILTESGMMRGDIDHFFPKSKYPYLSLSIYNLIPVCRFCNSSFKLDKEFGPNDLHPFEESFDDYVKFKIFMSNSKEINIKVEKVKDSKKVDNYLEFFKIQEQYNYHTNHAEELIYKKLTYSKEYISDIKKVLNNYDIPEDRVNEILLGYNPKKSKINDESLAKLKRDLANQLGLDTEFKEERGKDSILLDQLESLAYKI